MIGTILVVEDDPDTATLLRDALRKRGLDAEAVLSAPACLERLKTHPVDVVVTDIQMPEMSGIELCTKLRETYPDLLTIVVTGQGGLEAAIGAIRAGAYDFITKPVKVDALTIAVSRAIDHLALRRARTPAHADRADERHRRHRGIERRDSRDHRAGPPGRGE